MDAAITERTIAELPKCKILVRYGVGYDKIDIPALVDVLFATTRSTGPKM